MESEKISGQHLEIVDDDLPGKHGAEVVHTMGTVKLTEDSIVYIPTPTADPRGTPPW